MNKLLEIIEGVSKILSVVNGVVWLVIGIVILFAIIHVGTQGVDRVIGGTLGNQPPYQLQGGQQPQPQNQPPQGYQQQPPNRTPQGYQQQPPPYQSPQGYQQPPQ